MVDSKKSLFSSSIVVVTLTLFLSFLPFISHSIFPPKKMLYPPSLYICACDQQLSASDLSMRDGRWKAYNGQRVKIKNKFAYLWLEFPPQQSEKKTIHLINKEQNYYTELLKPEKRAAVTLFTLGDRIPASKSPFKQGKAVFPLNLSQKNVKSYVLEYHDQRGVIIDLGFVEPNTWFSSKFTEKVKTGFMSGILLSLLMYLVYFFLRTKNIISLSFSLFAATNMLFFAFETRILLEFIDPLVYPPWFFPFFLTLNLQAELFFIRTVFTNYKNIITTIVIEVLTASTALCALISFFALPLLFGGILTILYLSLYLISLQPLIQAIQNKSIEVLIPIIAILPLATIKLINTLTQALSMGEPFFTDFQILYGITASLSLYIFFLKKYRIEVLNPFILETHNNAHATDYFYSETPNTQFSVGSLYVPSLIYIYEENEGSGEQMAQILRPLGYSPYRTSSRLDILTKATTNSIDLLIIDHHSEGNEVVNMCRALRLQHLKQNLPILVISSIVSNNLFNEVIASGANDLLIQPFNHAAFISRIQSLLRLKTIASLNTDLSRSDSEKKAFLYFLTHNVNTPLTILLNRIQELNNQKNIPQLKEIIEDLEISSGEINDIVQNVLISLRISNKQQTLLVQDFNLVEVMNQLHPLLLKKAHRKNQTLQWIVPKNIPDISTDRITVKGILYNIIDNAIKFSPKNGLICAEVLVTHNVSIEISDSGPGINEQDLQVLFEPFQNFMSKPTGGESSTGLGLYVAKELSNINGATLTCIGKNVTNASCSGAKFILTLPFTVTKTGEEK